MNQPVSSSVSLSGSLSGSPELSARGVILHILSCDLWGGREAQVGMLLEALHEAATPVVVIAFHNAEVVKSFQDRGLQVEIADEQKGFFSVLWDCLQTVKRLKPKIIVSHGYKENVIGALLRCFGSYRWIAMYHGAPEISGGLRGIRMRFYEGLSTFLVRKFAQRIIFVSNDLMFQRRFGKDPRAVTIYNTVESTKLSEKTVTLSKPAVVCVGRLVPVKRFDIALKAASVLSKRGLDLHWYVVGSGPEEASLRSLAVELGIEQTVHFCGFQSPAWPYIECADIFVISSDHEGVPTVLLEALRSGKRIVSAAVGGIPEVLEKFESYPYFLFPRGNVDICAEMVERQVRTLGEGQDEAKVKRWAEILQRHFSPSSAAGAHREVYREVLTAVSSDLPLQPEVSATKGSTEES